MGAKCVRAGNGAQHAELRHRRFASPPARRTGDGQIRLATATSSSFGAVGGIINIGHTQ